MTLVCGLLDIVINEGVGLCVLRTGVMLALWVRISDHLSLNHMATLLSLTPLAHPRVGAGLK